MSKNIHSKFISRIKNCSSIKQCVSLHIVVVVASWNLGEKNSKRFWRFKRAFERAFYFIEGVEREGRRYLATGNAKREYMYTMVVEEKGEGMDEKGGRGQVFSRFVPSPRILGRRSLTSESPRRRCYPSHISPRDVLRISHPRSAFRCRYGRG